MPSVLVIDSERLVCRRVVGSASEMDMYSPVCVASEAQGERDACPVPLRYTLLG